MFASDAVLRNLGMKSGVCSVHNKFTGTGFNNHTLLKKVPKAHEFSPDQTL